MSNYTPPIKDMMFALEHVVGYPDIAKLPGFEHADLDSVGDVLGAFGEYAAEVVAPTNRAGDLQGAVLGEDGNVTTSPGFKDAYDQYVESGWGAVPLPEIYGGGDFPRTVGLAIHEMLNSANMAFALAPLLGQGAIGALLAYGSDELKDAYLPKMVSGEWAATMNLTEPHAGTDVGALTTRAVKNDDGTYRITGQKIFITFGDHDLTDQIIHLVLARTPDAPAGTKGISCFIVPKFHINDDESLGERNGVTTVSLEEKMGIHGSPTAVLAYDDAVGYLIGEENQGMRIMFNMMNSARLSVGVQGLAVAERAYQDALAYAKERKQGRMPGASEDSFIIEFPDVRRMLLTQKAYIAAMRRIALLNAAYIDKSTNSPDEAVRERASEMEALLTPISKAFGSDLGNELVSLAMQIYGGMGYIEETGAAQYYRDVRIAAIYEGTNGVQALDFVGRKMPVRMGQSFMEFIAEMKSILPELEGAGEDFASMHAGLSKGLDTLEKVTGWMMQTGLSDQTAVMAGATPFLRQWSVVVGAWLMAKSALAAREVPEHAKEQLVLARFYIEQLLPQAAGLAGAITATARDLFELTEDEL